MSYLLRKPPIGAHVAKGKWDLFPLVIFRVLGI